VHVEYIGHLASRYEQANRNLLEFCLAPAQDASPISIGRTAQNAFTASSVSSTGAHSLLVSRERKQIIHA
jgi:hypothetical protein